MDTLQSTKCLLCDELRKIRKLCTKHYGRWNRSNIKDFELWLKSYTHERRCRTCNEPFILSRKNIKYCSKMCRMVQYHHVNSIITLDYHKKLKKLSKQLGKNSSEIIREVLYNYLDNIKELK